ncbi:diaminopimelate epimerase [Limosilactobacillus fermentum]|uniref:Diaminopimelate epimerase n=1 Tax=Limosilactobacillus fermentum TaxID=1613 RepID=A0AAJ4GFJ0_LIMFE|nr:diaminopimelate epimerase [Limosilactobacillus fermentum]OFT07188.1 diaminopimelate epimerase [Lactobacillus sp. HMSC24D01]QIX58487.1 Diaminopimelate epimerase [Limosilactobacillus fermentum]QQO43237.1 diaminopimelate epimerase [Limosilactobacillus fermentum]
MAQLLKVHGSQNQFFLLDQTTLARPLSDPELRALGLQLCDPAIGILGGADGLLVVNDSDNPAASGQMRVINADGSEASMCGNGLRTVARYLAEKTNQTRFQVETMKADLTVAYHDDFFPGVPGYAVEISPVRFNKEALPFDQVGHERLLDTLVPEFVPGWRFSALAVPNPHLIAFVSDEELAGPVLGELGQRLNGENPYFADGVNVNFAHILGPNELFVRTYERGVGFTNACGTGMSATTLAFALTHPDQAGFETPITVYNPGGMVKTILHHHDARYTIDLIGNATFTNQIEVHEAALHDAQVTDADVTVTETGEQAAYLDFVASLPQVSTVKSK